MRKSVLIIAAPFGYGPAARALLVAQGLVDVADVTILSTRDAYRFVERHKPDGVACRRGVFRKVFLSSTDLAAFDLFLSVNHEPAVQHLVDLGLAARTVFIDSVLPWRAANHSPESREPILSYLVQDFPGVGAHLARCQAQTVALTAPMLWNGPHDGARPARPKGHVILHVGGVTSPLVSWEMLRRPIEGFLARTHALTRSFGRRLVVIGSRHLGQWAQANAPDVAILGDISPPETAALIGRSEVLLSTPGIGAIYEAMASAVPVVVFPPTNSTQVLQYAVFTHAGLPGTMTESASAALRQNAAGLPWQEQTTYSINFLHQHLTECLSELPRHLELLLSPGSSAPGSTPGEHAAAAMFGALSKTSAIDLIRQALGATPQRPSG